MSKYAELITVKKGLYGRNQINRNTSPDHVSGILKNMTENCEMLKEIADALDTDGGLNKFLQTCQEDVVKSYLAQDLLNLYKGAYFETGIGYEKMVQNLKNILKVPTEEQVTRQARSEFSQITRRTDIEETFSDFLARLNSEVQKFCTQSPYNITLVDEQFKNSLRDIDRTFLLMLTHDKTGADKIKYEAKMLDAKNMHKRHPQEVHAINAVSQAEASVAALADSVTEFIKSESEARRKESELREERDQKRWAEMENRIEALTRANFFSQSQFSNQPQMMRQAQLNHMAPPTQTLAQPFYVPNNAPHNVNNIQNTPKITNNPPKRKPVKTPCYECGSRFHLTKDCKGDCKLSCWLCGVVGHTALAKKFHGPDAPKNE